MKKLTLLLALSFVVVCGVQAQKMKLGLKGGLNFPSASAFGIDDVNDNASGYHVGAFASFKLAVIGVQPEVLYSFTKFSLNTNQDLEMTYINIPVMLKFYPIPGLNLQAGPQFGVLAGTVGRLDTGGSNTQKISDALSGSDVSVAVGAGFDAPKGIDIHVRYVIGLSDNNDIASATESIKNTTFQVSVGYAFLKKG